MTPEMPFPGCARTLDVALDEIEEFLEDHVDGAPDAPVGRQCGRLLAQLQYVRALSGHAVALTTVSNEENTKLTPWDYHPDPMIDAQVRAEVLESELADLKVGYPARWWLCPVCAHSHRRGFFPVGAMGSHRCLNCGYVGERGVMDISRPVALTTQEHAQ